MKSEEKLRQIKIDGCEEIGRGSQGIVYRLSKDSIVKVYHKGTPLEAVINEREMARWAYVRGVPSAIPFEVVRAGERYGAIFQMADVHAAVDYIHEAPGNEDDFVLRSVELMEQIHAVEIEPGELPDMKEMTTRWAQELQELLAPETYAKLCALISAIPASRTLLHADFHIKNIFLVDGVPVLMDMHTLCMGDPIFELATICNSYHEFPSIAPEAATALGVSVEEAESLWEKTLDASCPGIDEKMRADVARRARILGCVRIVPYMKRQTDSPVAARAVATCVHDITELLA